MRAHLSLDVKNVAESVAFCSKLFGVEPQKQNSSYAKFDLKESALNFARQDKLWFQDPDGNPWEVFYVYEQLPITENPKKTSCCG